MLLQTIIGNIWPTNSSELRFLVLLQVIHRSVQVSFKETGRLFMNTPFKLLTVSSKMSSTMQRYNHSSRQLIVLKLFLLQRNCPFDMKCRENTWGVCKLDKKTSNQCIWLNRFLVSYTKAKDLVSILILYEVISFTQDWNYVVCSVYPNVSLCIRGGSKSWCYSSFHMFLKKCDKPCHAHILS